MSLAECRTSNECIFGETMLFVGEYRSHALNPKNQHIENKTDASIPANQLNTYALMSL